jgi:bifunctional glutamyl/prolyl-tRNA synthetase
MKDADQKVLIGSCEELEETLRTAGIRVKGDYRDNYSPGWKFNHWELKVREHAFVCLP